MEFFDWLKDNHLQELQSMVGLALVDGELATAEYDYLLAWTYKEGIEEDVLHRTIKNRNGQSETLFECKTKISCFRLLYESVILLLADHVIHPKEIEYCVHLAEHFHLSSAPLSLIHRLVDCVRAGYTLEEAYKILEEEHLVA